MKLLVFLLCIFTACEVFAQQTNIVWHRLQNKGKSTVEYIHYGFDLSSGDTYYAYESTHFKKKNLVLVKREGMYIFLKFEEISQIYQFEYPNETALEAYPVPPFLIRINPDGSRSKFVLENK
jgi:hypothetical protein